MEPLDVVAGRGALVRVPEQCRGVRESAFARHLGGHGPAEVVRGAIYAASFAGAARRRAETVGRLQRALEFAGLTMIGTTGDGASRP
ncbi:hypothetical protein GCM10009774_31190 [Cellulomonas gelida]|uniref:Uncharacterized protein n=1 Tax=Cellulomonas gelida TaxID=1712 RepID=A0A4Y3KNM1_9CELL|nr:hypothetical protein CGE01nite_17590 [Cellulomonas gelida]GGL38296.1 hypothetical protein GCM10009774_31190 [Cellulomonas gelida]